MVSSEEEPETKQDDALKWDVDMEIQLFYAMANHKPVGINKHFQMACIWEKLSNSVTKEISTQDIWKHLGSLYDFTMLDEAEPIPFPNHEITFCLPENEFGALMKQKSKEVLVSEETEDKDGRSPSPKSTPRSNSKGTASKDNMSKGTRKDSISALATKTRKESGSSHASTDTPSIKSEKEYDRRRDSRDSNASGPRDGSSGRKSTSHKDKTPKSKISSIAGQSKVWDSPQLDEETVSRRGRRRANTSTPPSTTPAKRRRT
ncbi:MRG/MORF4L-binding protein isoform X1 [Bombyx mandarina]|uniref:Mrg-binding protein n=2 Tax=Bombyx TaxID=7090 RepID=A0A8R2C910_BOMMO|nr:MRG/MORF4L-binding protein isoform X1 [Bombyx mori]XP_028040499.1 MRG/MORF4L-binding protein isoform X1 [Bombyx mandarina]